MDKHLPHTPSWLGIDLIKNRWMFPAIGAITTTMCGATYAFSVFIRPLEGEFGWTRADTVSAFSVCMLAFGLFVAIGGYFVDRFGPKIPFAVGGALMAVGQFLSARIQTLPGLVLTYGVVLGTGIGLAYTASTVALTGRWFPDKSRRGVAMGASVLGMGLGPFLAAPLWKAGIELYGWRTTYTLTGLIFFAITVVLFTVVQFPPTTCQYVEGKKWQLLPEGASDPRKRKVAVDSSDLTFMEAIRSGYLWLTGLLFFLTIFGGLLTTSQLAAFSGDPKPAGIGLTAGAAAGVVMALSIFNGLGRPAWGWISGKIGPKRSLILSPLTMVLAMIVLTMADSRGSVTLGAMLTGFAFGGTLALNPIMATALFGASYIGRIYGLIFFLGFGLGGFFGPKVGGMMKVAYGGYDGAFILSMALSVVAAILAAALFAPWGQEKRPRLSSSASVDPAA